QSPIPDWLRSGSSKTDRGFLKDTFAKQRKSARSRRSRSPRTSVFSRIRRERSRSPRQRVKEGGLFNRIGSRRKIVPARLDSYSQHSHSRYIEALSESKDSRDPFTPWIRYFDFPKPRMPNHIKTYKGSEDPEDHLKIFHAAAKTKRWAMPTWCHMFNSTLTGNARVWFDDLPPESIGSYDDLKKAFLENYLQQKKYIKHPIELYNIRQQDGEFTKDFIRLGVRKLQAASSTAHRMLKILVEEGVIILKSSKLVPLECAMVSKPKETPFVAKPIIKERVKVAINPEYLEQAVMIGSTLTEGGRNKLCGLLQRNLDIFAWKPADMTNVPRDITEHHLNIWEGCSPVRQKKRGQVAKRNQQYKKKLENCRGMNNKRNAYKGYHQIQMETKDEEKTAFIISQGILCYTKMPFGPRNAGATYQRLVDKSFHKQTGRNLEVYVDDLVIKSHTKDEIVRDIEETFKTIKEINMKLSFWGRRRNVPRGIKRFRTKLYVNGKLVLALVHAKYAIHYKPRVSVKGQILADFIVERPEEDSTDTPMEEEKELPESWILFTDGSSYIDVPGAGLILTNPEGMELTYALRFRFDAINNEAEYEALIARLRIAEQMEGTLPIDVKKARVIRRKPWRFAVINETLYKKSFLGPWLRCVGPLLANYVLREILEGSCSMHASTRSVVAKALRTGYYWPTMHKDARTLIRACTRKVKFLIVAMDYFTKWIEAKSIATISGNQIKKFMWDNIVCRFGLSREIISDNGNRHAYAQTAKVDLVGNSEALEINLDLLEERKKEAAIRKAISKAKIEKYFNSKVRNTSFNPGDLVYRNNDASRAEDTRKLGPK
nr:reverse transcriptase domain-containing protein [Tanacetum cinerariifolium]